MADSSIYNISLNDKQFVVPAQTTAVLINLFSSLAILQRVADTSHAKSEHGPGVEMGQRVLFKLYWWPYGILTIQEAMLEGLSACAHPLM